MVSVYLAYGDEDIFGIFAIVDQCCLESFDIQVKQHEDDYISLCPHRKFDILFICTFC